MRHVTFQLAPRNGELHPFDAVVRDDPELSRWAIHQVDPVAEEGLAILVEFDGPVEKLQRVVAEQSDVVSSSVTESDDGVFVYAHFEPDEWLRQLYEVTDEYEIFVDTPMYYTGGGALEITAIGELEDIRAASLALPDGVDLHLLSTGEYRPANESLYEQLTPRQQETLRAAVETGYYQEPRRVTYQDVADELGISAGTVGEHLRKIESTILTGVLPDAEAPTPAP
ncbi:helix-turn-helix domain-containing protein [Natronomonas salina]|uniref:helix-turn-helix domain-containing protein n=1 Tax=Natronomonas salina TaxID=1710540 RepID=UPI0015B7588A|nr:helix-turn-helix domain-containing protein [Natronomonas salina]QLD87607.1 helix-turn-helix domain-containing protein [Natronomonas salina]